MDINLARAIASVSVCCLAAYVSYITDGRVEIGWAIFGLFLIWVKW